MKHFLMLLTLLIIWSGLAYSKPYIQTSASFGIFHSSLSRYGEWIESDFGYAWRPMHVVHNWRPYLHGRWVWTDYGWYWVSNEPFGWATFHYGRWNYDDYYGWIWIPDYDWGPAWVEWCYNDDYIGWAPLPTYATFNISFGITFSNHWETPYHYWNFIPCRDFTTTRIIDHVQPVDRNRRIYGETRGVEHIRYEGNRVINRGIDVNTVEQRTNTRIRRVEVVNRERGESERFVREGGRERIETYRPQIEKRAGEEQSRSMDTRRKDNKPSIDRGRSIELPKRDTPTGRDAVRDRGEIRTRVPSERRIETTQPQQRDFQQEQQQRDKQQRQESFERRREQQRDQWQRRQEDQRMREQQVRENRNREMPRYEKHQPQIRERSAPQIRERLQPTQRSPERREESRGNTEKKRRP